MGKPSEWSKPELVRVMRHYAKGGYLTRHMYNALRKESPTLPDGRVAPWAETISFHFGSWKKACAAAGLRHGRDFPQTGQRRWTDDEIIEAVAAYIRWCAEEDYLPSLDGYHGWRCGFTDLPSSKSVQYRFGGGWEHAYRKGLQALLLTPSEDEELLDL